MKTSFGLSLAALALLPAVAVAVPCQVGCRVLRDCDGTSPAAAVIPYTLNYLSPDGQRLDLPARSRKPLLNALPQNPIEVFATCDDLNVVVGPGAYSAYLERNTSGVDLLRHRVDVDARGYVGNADPVSGERGWWPGLVSWIVPMASGITAELRVDYSSYRSGYDWSHVGNQLRVVLDGVPQEVVLTSSDQFALELNWTPEGEAVVLVANLDASGQVTDTTAIPILGTATENFRPLFVLVGRSGSAGFRWSSGGVKLSSELSYAQ